MNGVSHPHIQGDEIEPVIVFPVVETSIDLESVVVELFSEETLLLVRAKKALSEVIVLAHDTDLFLIEHPHRFATVASGLLGWRPTMGTLDAFTTNIRLILIARPNSSDLSFFLDGVKDSPNES